jgi:putative transposase
MVTTRPWSNGNFRAERPLETTVEDIWTRSAEEHRRAKLKEAVVLAFLDMERNGKVKRTSASIRAALSDIKLAAGKDPVRPQRVG